VLAIDTHTLARQYVMDGLLIIMIISMGTQIY